LAFEDGPVTDDERALVVTGQAPGLPAGQDVRVPEHAVTVSGCSIYQKSGE
jgi:hypothetical protein